MTGWMSGFEWEGAHVVLNFKIVNPRILHIFFGVCGLLVTCDVRLLYVAEPFFFAA